MTFHPKYRKSKYIVEKCPKCGDVANLIHITEKHGDKVIASYECPKGHVFTKEFKVQEPNS